MLVNERQYEMNCFYKEIVNLMPDGPVLNSNSRLEIFRILTTEKKEKYLLDHRKTYTSVWGWTIKAIPEKETESDRNKKGKGNKR